MKLRNKENGVIYDFSKGNLVIDVDDNRRVIFNSLAELNAEWEDYEEQEPLRYWCISEFGHVKGPIISLEEDEMDLLRKEVGNYFETKEEAEKAVEKLKAWKRLRDRGVTIHSCEGAESCENFYRIIFSVRCDRYWSDRSHSVDADLNLLFGGEE